MNHDGADWLRELARKTPTQPPLRRPELYDQAAPPPPATPGAGWVHPPHPPPGQGCGCCPTWTLIDPTQRLILEC